MPCILIDAAFEPFVKLMSDEKMRWANVPARRSYRTTPANLQELQTLFDEYELEVNRL